MDERKEEKVSQKIINKLFSIYEKLLDDFAMIIFIITSLIAPVIIEFSTTDLKTKIFLILGSVFSTIYIIYLLMKYFKTKNKRKFNKIYFLTFVFYIYGIISYIKYNILGLKNVILALFIFCYLFYTIYTSVKALSKKTFLSENLLTILFSFSLTFFSLGLFLNEIDYETAKGCFIICFGLMYLVLITLIIIKYLLSEIRKSAVHTIIGVIVWSSIVIFSFPYYIKWCGVYGESFDIFLNTYTAFIGGGLTLIGVGWTIRKNGDDIKKERQLSMKPLIYPLPNSYYKKCVDIVFTKNECFENCNFQGFIKNTDNGILIVNEIKINGEVYKTKFSVVLEKDAIGQIIVYSNEKITIKKMYLKCKDILGNNIKYEIIINDEQNIEAILEK